MKPTIEPGWEIASGRIAAEQWGDKNPAIHQFWSNDELMWKAVGWSKTFSPGMDYRRPIPAPPESIHFL